MDISQEGMFIESQTVFREGALLHFLIQTHDTKEILLDAKVRWSKKYAARYSHKLKSGMGVLITDFQQGKEEYQTFCPREICINCTPLPEDEEKANKS